MNGPRTTPVAVALLALACHQDPDVVGILETDGTGAGSSGGTGTMDSDGSGATTGTPAEPCEAVDILLVVDNSPGMEAYQQTFLANLPALLDGLSQELPAGTDVHIGVTTSSFCDPAKNPAHAEEACAPQETEAVIASAYVPPPQVVGPDGYQGRLIPNGSERWAYVSVGHPLSGTNALSWLEGVLPPGDDGCEMEFDAAAAFHALSSDNASANAGFLRPGALLGLFVVSDGADQTLVVESAIDLVVGVREATAACDAPDCVIAGALLDDGCAPDANASHLFLSALDAGIVWSPIAAPGLPGAPAAGYDQTLRTFTKRLGQACGG